MHLHTLLTHANIVPTTGANPQITQLCFDSRQVKPGSLFVAIRGTEADGHRYIAEAAKAGAAAVVCERPAPDFPAAASLPMIAVDDSRKTLGDLASAFYNNPSSRVRVIGITGTKGKTTTSYILKSILAACGVECGVLGTIGYEAFGKVEPALTTTPDAITIQRFLDRLARPNAGYAAMEVSSHALSQHRTRGITFASGVFTNLSGDHLDYHKTMAAYLEAKAQLFDSLTPFASAVINGDCRQSLPRLIQTEARPILYGRTPRTQGLCLIRAEDVRVSQGATQFRLILPGTKPLQVTLPLVGYHNVDNTLAAASCAWSLGIDPGQIHRGLETLKAVPGRLEAIDGGQPFSVYVDYAHTDASLQSVLQALRTVNPRSRIICLFGCGGMRDRTKRPRMAAVAEQLANAVIVTSDNPRTEDPRAIINDVLAGFRKPQQVRVELDRRAAINEALAMAHEGDVVLLAGKGHETYQICADGRSPFDDREVARAALKGWAA